MTRRKADPERQQVHVALETFACADEHGNPLVIRNGQRVRGGDITRRFPQYFVEEDTDDAERAQARAAVVDYG